jgi:hypothetical protein
MVKSFLQCERIAVKLYCQVWQKIIMYTSILVIIVVLVVGTSDHLRSCGF